MTRPALTVLLALAAITTAGLAALGSETTPPSTGRSDLHLDVGEPTPTPAPPALPVDSLDRQDRTAPRQRRAESHALARRALLTQLPLTRSGVTIELAGLDADGRHALLTIQHPRSSRRYARAIYRRALRTAHDNGHAYRTRYTP
jgi:hypothetical protein